MNDFQKLYDLIEENSCRVYHIPLDFYSNEKILVYFEKYDIREALTIFTEFENATMDATVYDDEIVVNILDLIENNTTTLEDEKYWKDKFIELEGK